MAMPCIHAALHATMRQAQTCLTARPSDDNFAPIKEATSTTSHRNAVVFKLCTKIVSSISGNKVVSALEAGEKKKKRQHTVKHDQAMKEKTLAAGDV